MQLDIAALVDRYGLFEQRVRKQKETLCGPTCACCRRVCCRVPFCVKTCQRMFLTKVMRRFASDALFDAALGWLSHAGCTLVAGRPPVCYELLCRDIPNAASHDPDRRHAMQALSMLVIHVGRRSISGCHLVEITCESELCRMKPDRCTSRLDQAQAGLQAVMEMLDGHPSAAVISILSRITPPSRTDGQTIRRLT